MAERITLTRNFNTEWLNAAARFRLMGLSREEAHAALDELIAQRISSKDNIRKIRTIMLQLWFDNEDWFQNAAIQCCRDLPEPQWLPVQWSLILLRYPVFFDLASTLGTMFDYKDTVLVAQVREHIFEKWGARATLLHSLSKNIQTLRDMNVLTPAGRTGEYGYAKHDVSDTKAAAILLAATMACSKQTHIAWNALIQHPAIFPFNIIHVSQGDIAACEMILLEKMGDGIVLRLADAN